MGTDRGRATVAFSCLGHFYIHLCTAFYFVIVLTLEDVWRRPYHELIELWTLGSLLVGAAALPAGMLSDRIGAARMMVIYFLGMGLSAVAAGFTNGPTALMVALSSIGLFAAVYHPVGIPWLVRSAGPARGRVLGFNGVFGSLGSAAAAITAGSLIHVFSWRAAFFVPGAVCALTGVALAVAVARGVVTDGEVMAGPRDGEPTRNEMMRAFSILVVTMFLAGVVYHTTQTALPKVFAERQAGLAGEGVMGVGILVAVVYAVAGAMQIIGGVLADRFPLKPVYLGAMLVQVPTLWLAASLGGLPLMVVATVMVMAGAGALPAENMLLARYTPEHRHGLVFGIKFVLAFGAAPVAVQLVAFISERTGGFYWVFASLAAMVVGAMAVAAMLPGSGRTVER